MIDRFRSISLVFMMFFIFLFVAGGFRNGMNPIAYAFDEEHDTGHDTSGQDDNDEDNPNDDDNQDEDEDPVELLTGNLRYQNEDLAYLSGQSRLGLIRYYNSQDRYNGPLGYGWNFNFNMKAILVSEESQSYVIVRDFSGVRYKFKKNTDGSYQSPPGWFLQLTKDAEGRFQLTKPSGEIYNFDTVGDLVRIGSCCRPDRLDLIYDAQKRLVSVQDSHAGSFSLSYNNQNKVVSIEDHGGRQVFYSYNEEEELKEFLGPGGQILRYSYDENHNLTAVLNGLGEVLLQNEYDDKDRVVEQTNRRGTFTFSYDVANRRVTIRDQHGKTRVHQVNEYGQPVQLTDQDGNTEYYTWTDEQRLSGYTNKLGEAIQFEYDTNGNRTSTIFNDGREIQIAYNESNKIVSLSDSTGYTTTFEYSAEGFPTRKNYPSGQRYQALGYSQEGKVNAIYNALSSPEDPTYRLLYAANGQISKIVYPKNQSEQFLYNDLGYLRKWLTRSGSEIFYGYNDAGLVDGVSYKIGNDYLIYTYQYDVDGNLTEIIDPGGESIKINIDKYGRIIEVMDASGNSAKYAYSEGNQSTRTDANGQVTQYSYDAMGRRTGVSYPDGSSVSYTYDKLGRLTSADDGTVFVSFAYDLLGKVTQLQCPYLQKTVDYEYDAAGRLIGITVTDHTDNDQTYAFDYEYNPDGLVTSISNPNGMTTTVQYDLVGRPILITYPNGIEEDRTYNDMGLVERITYKKGETVLEDLNYNFDLFGNVIQEDRNGEITGHEYDDLNRLTQATLPDGSTIAYAYDMRDNRTSRTASAHAVTYSYDKTGRLTGGDGITYTYDNNGNLIGKDQGGQVTNYTYDYENRLTGITLPDGTTISYRYYPIMPEGVGQLKALGEQMIGKTVSSAGEVRYLVGLDGDPLMTMAGDNSFQAWHFGSTRMDDMILSSDGAADAYHLRDLISTVIALADGTGTVTDTFSYLPYGSTSQAGNPFGFTGRIHQERSGLIYYRARFYDPETGRFITKDDLRINPRDPRRYNLYAYVLNNPTNFIDPTGHEDRCPGGAWTGTVAGGEAHFFIGASVTSTTVCCTVKPSLCCSFFSLGVSGGLKASASGGGGAIQFVNCSDADAIAGWGGGVSGEAKAGAGVDVGVSVGTSGCAAVSAAASFGVGGGVSLDLGYTWNTGCT